MISAAIQYSGLSFIFAALIVTAIISIFERKDDQ